MHLTTNQYGTLSLKVPKHTEQNNNWATSNFDEWQRDYHAQNPGSETERDILESTDA